MMRITRAVTHIHLCAINDAKVATPDAVAAAYEAPGQYYVTFFCTEAEPDDYADPCFSSPLSQRWQRVAVQQAAGIARSWRSNHQRDHANSQIAFERPNVATMRFKTRRMNAYLHGSSLAHVPNQLPCGAAKRGVKATAVKSAYTSQERPRRHYVAGSNRPEQQTFCCGVCGWRLHADHAAADTIAARFGDCALQATRTRQELKALLDARHQRWRPETGWSYSNRPPSCWFNRRRSRGGMAYAILLNYNQGARGVFPLSSPTFP